MAALEYGKHIWPCVRRNPIIDSVVATPWLAYHSHLLWQTPFSIHLAVSLGSQAADHLQSTGTSACTCQITALSPPSPHFWLSNGVCLSLRVKDSACSPHLFCAAMDLLDAAMRCRTLLILPKAVGTSETSPLRRFVHHLIFLTTLEEGCETCRSAAKWVGGQMGVT